tara:strand:- start:36 stop:779 length:744 start_codon:yes stop_codon:yes gene_type:complete
MNNYKIFGEIYANIYDEIYNAKNYVEECDILEQIFKNKRNVTSILDLGCGTGNHAAELATRGYKVIGLDQSDQMIKVAIGKNLEGCSFQQSDIRAFDLKQSFDVVILMFNVVGYLLDKNSLIALFSTARQHLAKGGLLIYDFWYAPAVRYSPPIKSGSRRAKAELKIHRNTIGELDLKNNLIRINCELKRGPIEVHETHNVRYFDLDELRSLMLQTYFEKINFSIFGDIEQAPNKNTWQAMAWSKAV